MAFTGRLLLIVPQGIEIKGWTPKGDLEFLLIVPQGIEMHTFATFFLSKVLLIVPQGIEIRDEHGRHY